MKFLGHSTVIASLALGITMASTAFADRIDPGTRKEPAPRECPGLSSETEQAKHEDRQPGVVALIGNALQKVCLNDEQRDAIERIGDRVMAKEEVARDARHELDEALVDQLRAGNVDKRALDDEVRALIDARKDAAPVLRSAIEELHEVLDPGQRRAFVDALDKQLDRHLDESRGWLATLKNDLQLSDEQEQEIRKVLIDETSRLDTERKRFAKVVSDFAKDDFSIDRSAPPIDVEAQTRDRTDAMIRIAGDLKNVLTKEQWAQLAKKLERAQDQGGSGGSRHGAGHEGAGTEGPLGTSEQAFVTGGGYRAGSVRGWSSGYSAGMQRGYSMGGYRAGYPMSGGFSPGMI